MGKTKKERKEKKKERKKKRKKKKIIPETLLLLLVRLSGVGENEVRVAARASTKVGMVAARPTGGVVTCWAMTLGGRGDLR